MKLPVILSLLAAASVLAQEAPRASVVVEGENAAAGESVSRTKQFRVTGGDAGLRGTVVLLADEARDALRALTDQKAEEDVKVPIRVILVGKPGDPSPPNPIAMKLFFDDTAYQLQVFVHLGRGIEREKLAGVLTAALIHERTLRNVKPDGIERSSTVTPWLVDGLREAAVWRAGNGDRRAYEALFKRGGIYNMNDLFKETDQSRDQMDAAMRLGFRVSSGALVMALLEQPQGKEGFRNFLSEVSLFEGDMPALLRKHFPELNLSEASLAKWWMLQMASKGTAPLSERLSVSETETELNDVLKLHVRSVEKGVEEKPLSAWAELAELKPIEKIEAVRPAQDALTRLSYRCFPSYYPAIAEYQAVLASVEQGKTKDVDAKLAELSASRSLMIAKAERARDYMDWFEITRARETSGAFDDYLRLKDGLQERTHRRNDPLSEYLDKMDELFRHGQQPKREASPQMLLPP
ncbi:MAG TPA: hypothetical protein VM511_06480 [Luteolibacter sp.]|nr:hypothetical protein [Luteolibacter sp.]